MEQNTLETQQTEQFQTQKINSDFDIQATTPSSVSKKMFLHHLSLIFRNIGVVACIVGIMLFFSFIIPVLYFCLLIFLTLGTLGAVFAMIPNFVEWWEALPGLSEQIGSTVPTSLWVLGVAIVASIMSLIFMISDKQNRSVAGIVGCVATIVISVIAIVVFSLLIIGG